MKTIAIAALTCALALPAVSAGVAASSFIRPVAITDWNPETDPNRLEPGLLANLRVAICDYHFPAGSLARTQIEEGLALFAHAGGVNINISYVNATQYVPHKRKEWLFATPPTPPTLQIDYVDNAIGARDPQFEVADDGPFFCEPPDEIKCSQWVATTCRYSARYGWHPPSNSGLTQATVIAINPYCTDQATPEQRWTTDLSDVFTMDGVSHEMGHVVGLTHVVARPFTSNVFQSKMAQGIGQLSAYDLGFLTHYYPASIVLANSDYSASSALRLEQGDGSIEGGEGDFAEYNPKNLYASTGYYKSCKDGELPVYTAQFFDKSPVSAAPDVDVRFIVSTPPGTWIEMHRERVPLSTSISQFNQIDVTSPPLALGIAAFGLAVAPEDSIISTLQFEIDPSHATPDFAIDNNNVSMTLNLYRDRSLCPDRPRRLAAEIRSAGDAFGGAIAAAGNRVVSGAKSYDVDAAGGGVLGNAGAAWVHTVNADNGRSPLEGELVPTGVNARAADDQFGSAVAMTGNLVAVGAPAHDFDSAGANALVDAGAVYLFRRSGTTWTMEAKVTPSIGERHAGDKFGSTVALSPDGLILAVGAPFDDYDTNGLSFLESAGAVYVFRNIDGRWISNGKLVGVTATGDRHAGDLLGGSLALAPGKLAVGAPNQDYDAAGSNFLSNAGAVYVFSLESDFSITLQEKLVSSGIAGRFAQDYFGASIAMYRHTSDRYTLVAGAYGHDYDPAGFNYADMAGAAYIFTAEADGLNWTFRQKLTGEPGTPHRNARDYFGRSVALFGTRLIVGADGQDYNIDGAGRLEAAGAVYLYEMVSEFEWRLIRKVGAAGAGTNARQANDGFGGSVAMTDEIFVVGVPSHGYDDSGSSFVTGAGATFVYFR